MFTHIDLAMYIVSRIIQMQPLMTEINPQNMQLKYIRRAKLPYEQEYCNVTVKSETPGAEQEFVTFYDKKIKLQYDILMDK